MPSALFLFPTAASWRGSLASLSLHSSHLGPPICRAPALGTHILQMELRAVIPKAKVLALCKNTGTTKSLFVSSLITKFESLPISVRQALR